MRFIRIGLVILKALLSKRTNVMDGSDLTLHVWVNEVDLHNVHQAVYPLYMELGRWDLALRSGLGRWMLKQRCAGILGAQAIRYRRPLHRLQRFTVRTRVASWDEKWFYLEQRFERHGELLTVGWVRLMFLDARGKAVQPSEAMGACGYDGPSPPPGELQELLEGMCAVDSGERAD